MGKKAKVQIQKAKPEKETESEMFIPLLSVEGREKEAGNGRRVGSVGRTQHETEVIQLSMNMENKSISVTCKTRKDKDSKGCFSYFCDVVKEGGTG